MSSVLWGLPEPEILVIVAALITGCAGIPGLLVRKSGGQVMAACLTVLAALVGIPSALTLLFARKTSTYLLGWGLPFGPCELAIDPLSAFFLLPVFTVSAAGSLFAVGYCPSASHRTSEPVLTFFFGLLSSSMALLLMARNGVMFLMIWEIMALSAFFLLVTEHGRAEVRRAGILYLISTHTGSAALLVFFSLLAAQTGSFLIPEPGSLSALPPMMTVLAAVALFGFGAKAGIMPLHIWLPATHANAPSHVSAIMSGVMLKMGLYGIFRTLTLFSDWPLLWGAVLVLAGILSALAAVAFAAAQHDLKRLLAYSSIENIGIIVTALGCALLGHASHNRPLAFLCLAAAMLHILNHSLFKPLLFMGSGVVIHAAGTRNLNQMGGMSRFLPMTSALFLIGSVSICGIPPLNGFVSEFLLYMGFFQQLQASNLVYLALLAPALALVGGLAVISFIKLFAAVFLGNPRSYVAAGHQLEAGLTMLLPMSFFALLCLLAGLFPQFAMRLATPAIASFMPDMMAASADHSAYMAILGRISMSALLLIAVTAAAALVWRYRLQLNAAAYAATWGCGYQRAVARMQYSATSFSEMSVSVFDGIVRQRIERPCLSGLFPAESGCRDVPSETILEQLVTPFFYSSGTAFAFLRRLQHGRMHLYMFYIFATLFVLMLWSH